MSKSKQQKEEMAQEEPFLFAIGTPEGDLILKVDANGNIMYLRSGTTMSEASKALWNSFQLFLPLTEDEVKNYPNDADLGAYVKAKMADKLKNL